MACIAKMLTDSYNSSQFILNCYTVPKASVGNLSGLNLGRIGLRWRPKNYNVNNEV